MGPAIALEEGSGGSGSGLEESGVVLQLVSGSLTLAQTTGNDSGLYSCQAGNAAGNTSVEVQLTVLGTNRGTLQKHCLHVYIVISGLLTVHVLLHCKHSVSTLFSHLFPSFFPSIYLVLSLLLTSFCLSVCLSICLSVSLCLSLSFSLLFLSSPSLTFWYVTCN